MLFNIMDDQIDIIMRQTNYSREECIDKLGKNNMNDIIKEYMGISLEPQKNRKKSLQQEIYYQIRTHMDSSINNFNKKQNEKLEKEIQESS